MADEAKPKSGWWEEFRAEFLRAWRDVPNKALFLGLLTAWLALFHFLGNPTFGYIKTGSLLLWLDHVYGQTNSEDAHGALIPLVVLVLFWWKRRELLALPARPWGPGLVLLAAATLLHVTGYLLQQPRVSAVALFGGMYALIGVVWGPAWLRASWFPMVLFAFSVPVGSLIQGMSFPLRVFVTRLAVGVCGGVLGVPVARDGTRMFAVDGSYMFEVDAACSGVKSLIAIVAFAFIYAMVGFKAPWRRLAILALAVPAAILGNVIRLMSIVVAAETFGAKAGTFVHDELGLLPYIPAFAALLAAGHFLAEKPVANSAPLPLEARPA
jgi:exosortase